MFICAVHMRRISSQLFLGSCQVDVTLDISLLKKWKFCSEYLKYVHKANI